MNLVTAVAWYKQVQACWLQGIFSGRVVSVVSNSSKFLLLELNSITSNAAEINGIASYPSLASCCVRVTYHYTARLQDVAQVWGGWGCMGWICEYISCCSRYILKIPKTESWNYPDFLFFIIIFHFIYVFNFYFFYSVYFFLPFINDTPRCPWLKYCSWTWAQCNTGVLLHIQSTTYNAYLAWKDS